MNKYKANHPKMYNNLRANICSEPMPCPVYCSPKGHKEGDMEGRPIHTATNTPATQLSKYFAKELNTLLDYVPAHLKNTADFAGFIKNLDWSSIHGFCSLNVCNLYGFIPLEDLNEKKKHQVYLQLSNSFFKYIKKIVTYAPYKMMILKH